MDRRLAAILAADVVGYSRLMSAHAGGGARPLGVGSFVCRRLRCDVVCLQCGGDAGPGVLTELAYLTPITMKIAPGQLAGGVLIAAGVYQFLPAKQACLRQCRTPIGFLMTQWRDGDWGAFVMGWRHGLFCVGCCWALMGLLFVAGVMNALWIVALTVYVLIEKLAPYSHFVTGLLAFSLIGMGHMDDYTVNDDTG